MDFQKKYSEYVLMIEDYLIAALGRIEEKNVVYDAMQYSLMNGGKRIRPVLALAFCEMLGGDALTALPFACALEMIHTYSLIHDDLPCMDDDDMRRGKPSCHKKFGEEYALLAGDGLLNLAFESIFGAPCGNPDLLIRCGRVISAASGIDGMIGGQTIDLLSENKTIDLQQLKKLHALKTGAMLSAPCEIGALCAEAEKNDIAQARLYGEIIGLQFQIVDDILDKTGTAEELGKPIGSDEENCKSTYVSLLGLEQARLQAENLRRQARSILSVYAENASFLNALTEELTTRKK